MRENKEILSVEISRELKDLVDADRRFNWEVVEAALWTEYGGHRDPALDRRVAEQENRVAMIRGEIDSREQELEREEQKLKAYKDELEKRSDRLEAVLDQYEDSFRPDMLSTDNIAVQKRADEAGVSPERFIEAMQARLEEDADGE